MNGTKNKNNAISETIYQITATNNFEYLHSQQGNKH